jgi:hypothetical protein
MTETRGSGLHRVQNSGVGREPRTYVQHDDGTVEADCTRCGTRFQALIAAGWTPHDENAFLCARCAPGQEELRTFDEVEIPDTKVEGVRHK